MVLVGNQIEYVTLVYIIGVYNLSHYILFFYIA